MNLLIFLLDKWKVQAERWPTTRDVLEGISSCWKGKLLLIVSQSPSLFSLFIHVLNNIITSIETRN